MFLFLLKLILLLYVIFLVYSIINNQKYNVNGSVLQINNIDDFKNKLISLNPIKIRFENRFNSNYLSNNFSHLGEIIDLHNIYYNKDITFILEDNDDIMFYNNKNKYIETIIDLNPLNIKNYSISIYKKINQPLKRCVHNYNLIGILDGETTIYIINPKHKDDILDKKNKEIKKWSHKIILKKDDLLLIPTNWYYFQEIKDKSIQYNINIDDIFTYLPNQIKNNILK